MSIRIKNIVLLFLAVLVGLALGYFIFGTSESTPPSTSATTATPAIWTCSMHPQIRQQDPGLCPLCAMDLIPLDESSTNKDGDYTLQMTPEAVALSNIQTSVIGRSEATDQHIPLSGKVHIDERRSSTQVAHINGRIEQLFVSFTGEYIKKGQRLASIYSPDLERAQTELLEALRLQDEYPNLLVAARTKLRNWKISDKNISQIETSGKIQSSFMIYADQSGVVTQKHIAIGDYIQKGAPLFNLIRLDKVWVLFDAYENILPRIKKGMPIHFNCPSLPGKTFTTHISFIDPVIHPKTRTASVRGEILNPQGLLKPEMLIKGLLESSKANTVELSVPKSAVLWTGKRSVVYTKVPNIDIPSFEYQEVEIGDDLGEHYIVLSGLKSGDEVVTNGSFTIDAAAQLNNQSSMMNRYIDTKKDVSIGTPDYTQETPIAFQEQLTSIITPYMSLKDALVATDEHTANTAAQQFKNVLELTHTNDLSGDALQYWNEQYQNLIAHIDLISTSDDIEIQRQHFSGISEILINSITAFGLAHTTIYLQHCPMAFDDNGGDWLALEEAIQNPYFGDKMMKCGIIKHIFNDRTD